MSPAERKFVQVLLACAAIAAGGLAIDLLVIPVRVLTDYNGHAPLSPLYAFWMPALNARILWAVAAAAGYVAWVWWTGCIQPAAAKSIWRVTGYCLWLVILALATACIRLPVNDL